MFNLNRIFECFSNCFSKNLEFSWKKYWKTIEKLHFSPDNHKYLQVELENIADGQYLLRARLLRENGRFLPKTSFNARRQYLCAEETGYLSKAQQRPAKGPNPMDPSQMTEMLKGNMMNMVHIFNALLHYVVPSFFIENWCQARENRLFYLKITFIFAEKFWESAQNWPENRKFAKFFRKSANWTFPANQQIADLANLPENSGFAHILLEI